MRLYRQTFYLYRIVSYRKTEIWKTVDWLTIILYVVLVVAGWFSICGASYEFDNVGLFDPSGRPGSQLMWMGLSVGLIFVLLMLESEFFDVFAYLIYAGFIVLLIATIFLAPNIKGSHSWLVLGPVRLQPAEFAKFATALAISKFMSSYGFNIHRMKDFFAAAFIIILPMICIVGQRETGSALVYSAFFLMFYREGMPGSILFTAVAMVVYFVVGVKYENVMMWDGQTSVGEFVVLLLVQIFSTGMVSTYIHNGRQTVQMLLYTVGITLGCMLFSVYVIPFDVTYVQLIVSFVLIGFLFYQGLSARIRNYYFIAVFALGSLAFFYSADYVLNNVMEPHQRVRINVLLGLEEDLAGAGYNVHQSEIAIGSGGLQGKGFLNGTQTKLKFVPEQDTDFIFCTVGEEEGFLGSAGVLLLFLALIIRLIILAERQPFKFGRVYGYSVLSIFLFHVFINVGMVLGLTPVIGIPLPFFSYGGSSLWGFTILLFIFLRIDAGRNLVRT